MQCGHFGVNEIFSRNGYYFQHDRHVRTPTEAVAENSPQEPGRGGQITELVPRSYE